METSGSSERSGTLERSISSAPGSRVSRILTQDRGKGSSTQGTSGPRHERSFGWWDPSGSCLRTYQASFLEMTEGRGTGSVYSESFPNWGLMLGGEFIAQPTPALRTSENGGGSWHIPTPTTADVYTGNMKSSQQSDGSMHSVTLPDYVEMFPTPKAMWNTPNTMDALEPKSQEALDHEHESARPGRSNPNNLRDQIAVSEGTRFWATPTGEDAKNTAEPGREKRHGPMLNLQVTQWPTPHASCSTGASTQGREGGNNLQTATSLDQEEATNSLNPDWVEQHLMSLPEGWTKLEPVPDGAYDEWFDAMRDGTWWDTERGLPRVTTGAKNRVNRLKMLGNGIVPGTLALFLTNGKRGESGVYNNQT